MLNWKIEPSLLLPYLPAGTELDDWNGNAYVSLVGFMFLDTSVLGLPIPGYRNFEEVNLRFYVKRIGPDSNVRRGVVFIKEIVPRRAIAAIARLVYNENYIRMPMRHAVDFTDATLCSVSYEWGRDDALHRIAARVTGNPSALVPGSEAEYITEHYWGYTRQRDNSTLEYEVIHPRWNVWRVSEALYSGDGSSLYGKSFGQVLRNAPDSAFVADGSAITVKRGLVL